MGVQKGLYKQIRRKISNILGVDIRYIRVNSIKDDKIQLN